VTGQMERVARPSVGPFRHESRWMSHGVGRTSSILPEGMRPRSLQDNTEGEGDESPQLPRPPNPDWQSEDSVEAESEQQNADERRRDPDDPRSQEANGRGFWHRFNPTVRTVSLEGPYARGGIEAFRRTPGQISLDGSISEAVKTPVDGSPSEGNLRSRYPGSECCLSWYPTALQ